MKTAYLVAIILMLALSGTLMAPCYAIATIQPLQLNALSPFDLLDSDADGCIDQSELRQAFARLSPQSIHLLFEELKLHGVQSGASSRSLLVTGDCDGLPASACEEITKCQKSTCDELELESTGITEISRGNFEGLGHLKDLDLSYNGLKDIPNASLADLVNLVELDFEHNVIAEVRPDMFVGLVNLEEVDLNYNHITIIFPNAFEEVSTLKEITIEGNGLVSLEEGAFAHLSDLEVFSLSANHIRTIRNRTLSGLENLERLYLNHNEIATIEDGAFRSLQNLEFLDISQNLLTTVASNVFAVFQDSGVALDLNWNTILFVQAGVMGALCGTSSLLSMDGNPSSCHCGSSAALPQCTCFTIASTSARNGTACIEPSVQSNKLAFDIGCGPNATERGCAVTSDSCCSKQGLSLQCYSNGVTIDGARLDGVKDACLSTEGGDFITISQPHLDPRIHAHPLLLGSALRLKLGANSKKCEYQLHEGNFSLTCPVSAGTGYRKLSLWYTNAALEIDISSIVFENNDAYCTLKVNKPHIERVSGCKSCKDSFGGENICCSRSGEQITIQGTNFGPGDALVFLNGQECSNLTHGVSRDSCPNPESFNCHRQLSCEAPALSSVQGSSNYLTVVQSNLLSTKWSKLFYHKCEKNQHQTLDNSLQQAICVECTYGKQSSDLDVLSCSSCEFKDIGSRHCNVPVMMMSMLFLMILFLAAATYKLYSWWLYVRARELTVKKVILCQQVELIARELDISLLQSAHVIEWDDLILKNRMAEGGFGEVWSAEYVTAGGVLQIAVKKMFNTETVDITDDDEIRFLSRVSHRNLVHFLGCGRIVGRKGAGNIFLCLEFMNRGDLRDFTWKKAQGDVLWILRLKFLYDSACGMAFLHEQHNSIHRDLKSPNILLAELPGGALVAKVADFGLAKIIPGSDRKLSTSTKIIGHGETRVKDLVAEPNTGEAKTEHLKENRKTIPEPPQLVEKGASISSEMTVNVGSLLWMSPEIIRSLQMVNCVYSQAVDVYAFGIIMYEVLVLHQPWTGKAFEWSTAVLDAVTKGKRPSYSPAEAAASPPGYAKLMEESWMQDPEDRPRFPEIESRLLIMMRKQEHARRVFRAACKKQRELQRFLALAGANKSGFSTKSAIPRVLMMARTNHEEGSNDSSGEPLAHAMPVQQEGHLPVQPATPDIKKT